MLMIQGNIETDVAPDRVAEMMERGFTPVAPSEPEEAPEEVPKKAQKK